MGSPLLEVVALHPADAEAAQAGGADRLHVVGELSGSDASQARSPEPKLVSSISRASDVPVRVQLRLSDGFSTTGGELARLIGLAEDYLAVGAEGVVFGFLNADLDIDLPVCATVAAALRGAPWTFHRAIDHALDAARAWRQVRLLAGLDAVLTAGSALGMASGLSALADRAAADPDAAGLTMAGGGLAAEHVPWLLRAGVAAFHVGAGVRPGRSWGRARVDAGFVRSWRMLLDDSAVRRSG
jgi:copper homeostasis protein